MLKCQNSLNQPCYSRSSCQVPDIRLDGSQDQRVLMRVPLAQHVGQRGNFNRIAQRCS